MIEAIVDMGRKPQFMCTDGETGVRNSGLFKQHFDENKITVHCTRSYPAFAERFIGTFKAMLYNRNKT